MNGNIHFILSDGSTYLDDKLFYYPLKNYYSNRWTVCPSQARGFFDDRLQISCRYLLLLEQVSQHKVKNPAVPYHSKDLRLHGIQRRDQFIMTAGPSHRHGTMAKSLLRQNLSEDKTPSYLTPQTAIISGAKIKSSTKRNAKFAFQLSLRSKKHRAIVMKEAESFPPLFPELTICTTPSLRNDKGNNHSNGCGNKGRDSSCLFPPLLFSQVDHKINDVIFPSTFIDHFPRDQDCNKNLSHSSAFAKTSDRVLAKALANYKTSDIVLPSETSDKVSTQTSWNQSDACEAMDSGSSGQLSRGVDHAFPNIRLKPRITPGAPTEEQFSQANWL